MDRAEDRKKIQVLDGKAITGISFHGATRIDFGTKRKYVLKCESEICLTVGSSSMRFKGVEPGENLEKLRVLKGTKVLRTFLSEIGNLIIELEDASGLTIFADQQYESWQLVGPKRFLIVSLPGGEIALWDGRK